MEYTFGKTTTRNGEWLSLKTKGDTHTSLTGKFELVADYSDCTITHRCVILSHYNTAEDSEGNCYDWYKIEDYSSHIDLAEIEREQLNNDIDELLLIIGGGENE